MSKQVSNEEAVLFADVRQMIEDARKMVSQTVNSGMTLLYWNIGRRINEEVLRNERAEYGKLIVATLSRQLLEDYGSGFSKSSISRMCAFHQEFPDFEIVATLSQQLSWSHFIEIIPLKEPLQREFYSQMCRIEKWDVRTLRRKIQSMLFERTAISQKPEELAQLELRALKEEDQLSPDLVFQSPYLLGFLGLKDTYLEKDLEQAILRKLESSCLNWEGALPSWSGKSAWSLTATTTSSTCCSTTGNSSAWLPLN